MGKGTGPRDIESGTEARNGDTARLTPADPSVVDDAGTASAPGGRPPLTSIAMRPSSSPESAGLPVPFIRSRAPQRRFHITVLLVLLLLLAVACTATWSISWHRGIDALRERATFRAERVNANLKATLDRYALLPYLVSTHPYIETLLASPPGSPARQAAVARANAFLKRVNHEAKANATYVIDASGVCVTASNWDQPNGFIGLHYTFRPYFTDALKGRTGRFFAIGTSNGEPGYYVSQPIRAPSASVDPDDAHRGPILGVAAVKLDLQWFEQTDTQDPLIATDEHGVIFLSSEPDWKYHTVQPLSTPIRESIRMSRQYATQPLPALPVVVDRVLSNDTELVHIGPNARYLASRSRLAEPHWELTTFTSLDPVIANANDATVITAFSGICLYLLGFYLHIRRARVRDMIRSGTLLRAAYAELNRRVAERTADLSAANALLQTEVSERTRAEQELRSAHRELMQTSKLAALGQMAAGITHELNQPLAALRTFSDNTQILLQRGQQEAAQENLRAIGALTERMGRITNQLKLFITKARPRDTSAPLPRAIANALMLLEARLQTVRVSVWYDPVCVLDDHAPHTPVIHDGLMPLPLDTRHGEAQSGAPDWVARCDQLRLEQLLINVIGNAVDALRGYPDPSIDIVTTITPAHVRIVIQDNGPGIDDEHLPHLFEPFYTTKENGEGMGLGLAICAAIASEHGGTLHASNRPANQHGGDMHGAIFVLTLRRVVDVADAPDTK
ncbi:ATP-binding protein [Robbsia andropogonis]|nr:ATP-binding protein [Robbsia andropogonis]